MKTKPAFYSVMSEGKLNITKLLGEQSGIHAPGTKVNVPHKGKMTPGKIVRHDKGDKHGSPLYVVDVGERESKKVPAHEIRKEKVGH